MQVAVSTILVLSLKVEQLPFNLHQVWSKCFIGIVSQTSLVINKMAADTLELSPLIQQKLCYMPCPLSKLTFNFHQIILMDGFVTVWHSFINLSISDKQQMEPIQVEVNLSVGQVWSHFFGYSKNVMPGKIQNNSWNVFNLFCFHFTKQTDLSLIID